MRGGDPALVVLSARGNSRAISANNRNLLGRVDLFGALRGLLGTFAALTTTLLLGEEGGDPSVVDEVGGSSEGTEEDNIQENTNVC